MAGSVETRRAARAVARAVAEHRLAAESGDHAVPSGTFCESDSLAEMGGRGEGREGRESGASTNGTARRQQQFANTAQREEQAQTQTCVRAGGTMEEKKNLFSNFVLTLCNFSFCATLMKFRLKACHT